MRRGKQIGRKFGPDGRALRYPGNTVISDVRPGNTAYGALKAVRRRLMRSPLSHLFILLPEDSYHMTVLRGLNDQVRAEAYWPKTLDKRATLKAMDEYVSNAVLSVQSPGPIRMAFHGIYADDEDLRIRLRPADESQRAVLSAYRDQVADALALRLPGHDAYTYHITLAYTLLLPDASEKEALTAWLRETHALLLKEPDFDMDAPYMAYYEDMLHFAPARQPSGRVEGGCAPCVP